MKLETETLAGAGQSAISSAAVAVRPSAEKQDDTAQPSASQGLPVIEGFFCKKIPDKKQLLCDLEAVKRADAADKDERLAQLEAQLKALETIDVHNEAQALTSKLSGGRRVFEMLVHSQPSFDTFKSQMRSAKERNVRLLHLSGHGKLRCGFLWLRNQAVSTEYEQISLDTFIGILKTELAGANRGTIECVVLNACETEDMGKKLRSAGVSHVVCWRSEVQDDTAREFALQFYASLNEQDPTRPRDYKRAFQHAVARIGSGGGAARAKAKHLAVGAVDYVCLLGGAGLDNAPLESQ
jgi:CHAT domain-containing protein